jgi:DNA mismatch repair protein MutS
VQSNHENGVSLLQVLDHTVSPMGARLLRKWVLLPLLQLNMIRERLDTVQLLTENQEFAREVEREIRAIGDLERLMAKTSVGKINPREAMQLRRALLAIEQLKDLLRAQALADTELTAVIARMAETLNPCASLRARIERDIAPDPPADIRKGNVIADGCSPALDELRHIVRNSRELLLEIQQREIERTGITSLKVAFNNVFGYYIEVTSKWKDRVPSEWIRKQTIANGERYITEELKVLEAKILGAEEKIQELEDRLLPVSTVLLPSPGWPSDRDIAVLNPTILLYSISATDAIR